MISDRRLILFGLICAAGSPVRAQSAHDAQAAIDRARAVSGGKAWNGLRGWHESGADGSATYERWIDPLRYGLRVETRERPGVTVLRGFNGAGEWAVTADGQRTGDGEAGPVAVARTEAFYGVYGFLFPSRFEARSLYLGDRRANGRSFDVVLLQPWGAAGRELWFDRSTGLLGRMVEHGAGGRTVTTELSDYRKVGPVKAAFRFVSDDAPGGAFRVRQLKSLDFAPADRALFSLPPQR